MAFGIVSSGGRVVEANGGTGTVTTNTWALARIRWVSEAAAQNDTCIIKDAAGNVIFESYAGGANWEDEVELGKVVLTQGVQITTLDSGDVFFYLR